MRHDSAVTTATGVSSLAPSGVAMTNPTRRPDARQPGAAAPQIASTTHGDYSDDPETAATRAAMARLITATRELVREFHTNSAYALNDILEVIATSLAGTAIVLHGNLGYATDLWPDAEPKLMEALAGVQTSQALLDSVLRFMQLTPSRDQGGTGPAPTSNTPASAYIGR
jgi:hypothetical protein